MIAQLLKAKYFPNCSFMEAELKKGASYTWRSIIAGRAVLQKGMRIQVGDGTNISLWDDPWVPIPYSFRPFSTVMEGTESWRVADVIDYDEKEWLTDVLGELFTSGEVDSIASIPLSIRGAEDRWVWHFDAKGVYNVRSGYHVFHNSLTMEQTASSSASEQGGPLRKYWNKIWHANVPPKIKVLIWSLVHGIVPTRSVLLSRHLHIQDVACVFCKSTNETSLHVFKECDALQCFWRLGPLRLKAKEHAAGDLKNWLFDVLDVLNMVY
ncbi:hypothetical protein ABKV19_027359 [Rosa sericea]